MANQDSPLWERLGMDHDVSPPWTLLNVVKALKFTLLTIPPEQRTIERGQAFRMVKNRATYQTWIPEAPAGKQVLFIPGAREDNHLVPAIIEEHKLYFDPCRISLVFMQDPENHTTWDVCQTD